MRYEYHFDIIGEDGNVFHQITARSYDDAHDGVQHGIELADENNSIVTVYALGMSWAAYPHKLRDKGYK